MLVKGATRVNIFYKYEHGGDGDEALNDLFAPDLFD